MRRSGIDKVLYSQYIGHCLENYVVYFVEYVIVYCLMFQVYVDTISIP